MKLFKLSFTAMNMATGIATSIAIGAGLLVSGTAAASTLTYTENDTSQGSYRALGYPVPMPISSQTPVAGFRRYSSLFARHQDLALNSALINGQIIGQTTSGEDIWAYLLSDDNAVTSEGNVLEGSMLQNGGIHAREWQSPEVVTGIMERFASNQDDQGFYQYLLENSQIILIPVLNVDGFTQTQRHSRNATISTDQSDQYDPGNVPRDGRMRRKNMRDVDLSLTTESDSYNGIDLNRNNAPYWATNPNRSSSREQSIVHHGSSPGSEPETQALIAAGNLTSSRLRFYIDTHSFTRVYFTPQTQNTRRNAITADVVTKMRAVNNNSYGYGPAPSGRGIGATDEYFAETYQIPSYTLETEPGGGGGTEYGGFGVSHDGFILPESQITRVIVELSNASILGYYMQAGAPNITAVEITRIDNDTTVFAGHWQADSASARSWQETVNLPLVADVNYRLRVSFSKTMRWRNVQDQVIQYPGQSIALTPTLSLDGRDANGNNFSVSLGNSNGQWLNSENSNNNGYRVYQDDSYMLEFSLDAISSAIGATSLNLAVAATGLAGQALDANPATVIDWQDGHWINLESADGTLGDVGGEDSSVSLIESDEPPPPPPTSSSGGGGSFGVGVLIGLIFSVFARRRNQ